MYLTVDDIIEKCVYDLPKEEENKMPDWDKADEIIRAVVLNMDIDYNLLMSGTHKQPYADIRACLSVVLREKLWFGTKEIARCLRRNRSSISHHYKNVRDAHNGYNKDLKQIHEKIMSFDL